MGLHPAAQEQTGAAGAFTCQVDLRLLVAGLDRFS